jgi:hypothetical protein
VTDLLLWVPLLVLPVVLLLAFSGCGVVLPQSGTDDPAVPGDEPKPPDGGEEPKPKPPENLDPQVPVADKPYRDVITAETTLVSWWRFGEASGTNVEDSEGTNDGTCIDGVTRGGPSALKTQTPPDPDHSAGFDGVRARVDVPHDPSLDVPLSFTVELWLRPAGAATGTSQALFSSADQTDGFELRLVRQATPVVVARVGSGSQWRELGPFALGAPRSTGWHYVALVYDGAAQTAALYLNDAQQTLATNVAYVPNTSRDLHFGADDSRRDGEFYAGDLDEVALYNSALGPAALKAHVDAGA